jgi:S-DNA-T family DNA segregation ATPase FtsK/SpoIIIE
VELDPDDIALETARDLAGMHERISPAMIQRRLRVGHVKATKIIEALEEEGLVGPREEGESRRVLLTSPRDASW